MNIRNWKDGETVAHYLYYDETGRIIGEVGLAGEIRRVQGVSQRLNEAFRLGFKRALVPTGSDVKIEGMDIVEVSRLEQAIGRVRIGA